MFNKTRQVKFVELLMFNLVIQVLIYHTTWKKLLSFLQKKTSRHLKK